MSALPPARAAVIDARRSHGAAPLETSLRAHGRCRPGTEGAFGIANVDTHRHALLIEHLGGRAGTRETVARARGQDIAIVVAGRATGVSSRNLRILTACGVRRAVVVVPEQEARDLVENHARHLLVGAGLDPDDTPALPVGNPDALTRDEVEALLDLIDRGIVLRPPGFFVIHAVPRGLTNACTGNILCGIAEDGPAFVHRPGVGAFESRVEFRQPARAGERVELMLLDGRGAPGETIISSERLPWATAFQSPDLPPATRDTPEMCFAFGGWGGFADGRIGEGLTVDAELFPVDKRIGLIRFQGAGLGPVRSIRVEDDPFQRRDTPVDRFPGGER